MKRAYKITFALASITLLASCNLEVNPGGAALMTAINYEGDTRIVYSLDDKYSTPGYSEAGIAPKPLNKGDYKPVFEYLQHRLGISMLENQAAANSGEKKSVAYFRDNWMTKNYADISMGTVYDINNYSTAGNKETILDLKPYIEKTKFNEAGEIIESGPLDHIATFLHDNPGVMMSIVTAKHSHPDQGAIYYVPYCDGFNDLEKATVIRADYVERLLDDDPDSQQPGFKFSTNDKILGKEGEAKYSQHYEPCYVDSEGNAPAYEVKVPESLYLENIKTIHKVKTENIITRQNRLIKSGGATSYALAKQFREYIDQRFEDEDGNSVFGPDPSQSDYSNVFVGLNACYDIDELVALMRLAKVSSQTFFPGKEKEIITMMPRTCDNMRASDLYRWAGQVFGVKGLESRNMYITINGTKDYGEEYGKYGKVYDVRGTNDMLFVLQKMRSLYQEGLILQDFDSMTATGTPKGQFANETLYSGGSDAYAGFMLYDYPKDLNDWNRFDTAEKKPTPQDHSTWVTPEGADSEHGYGYRLKAIIGAIAHWDTDGDGDRNDEGGSEWMPFTESWSSVKTSAACLSARLELPGNEQRLAAALRLIDYIYSDEGMFLYNYGPWEEGYITQLAGDYSDGKLGVEDPSAIKDVDYIIYQDKKYPCLTPEARQQHLTYSNFLRKFVGGTLPFGFVKLNAVSYQTMNDRTKDGVEIINKALALGTMKHALIGGYTPEQKEDYKIPFYQITPSAFFLTKGQSSAISSLMDKNTLGSMFTDSSSSNFNIWDSLIMTGEAKRGGETITLENYLPTLEKWGIKKLETYYQDAFEIMSNPIEEPTK